MFLSFVSESASGFWLPRHCHGCLTLGACVLGYNTHWFVAHSISMCKPPWPRHIPWISYRSMVMWLFPLEDLPSHRRWPVKTEYPLLLRVIDSHYHHYKFIFLCFSYTELFISYCQRIAGLWFCHIAILVLIMSFAKSVFMYLFIFLIH